MMRQVNSITEYSVGEEVDPSWVDHFINVLPPAYQTDSIIQLGEPYANVEGQTTYCTLMKKGNRWVYAGTCFYGKSEHVSR